MQKVMQKDNAPMRQMPMHLMPDQIPLLCIPTASNAHLSKYKTGLGNSSQGFYSIPTFGPDSSSVIRLDAATPARVIEVFAVARSVIKPFR